MSIFPGHLIPDLFRIVLEYSSYSDRNVWNYVGDTGLIHERICLNVNNVHHINRMVNVLSFKYEDEYDNWKNDEWMNIEPAFIPPIYLPNLKKLVISNTDSTEFDIANMPNLVSLACTREYYNFPLDLSQHYNLLRLHIAHNCELLLPPQLQILQLSDAYYNYLDLSNLPELRELYLSEVYNDALIFPYMPKLSILDLGFRFNHEFDLTQVPNLTVLKMGYAFNQPLDLSNQLRLKSITLYNIPISFDLTHNHYMQTILHRKTYGQINREHHTREYGPIQSIYVSPYSNIYCNSDSCLLYCRI